MQETTFDLEVPTPAEAEDLRRRGVQLPQVSGASSTPRTHSDFVDRRLEAVGFGIYLFGYHLYCGGIALPVYVPDSYVNLNLTAATPISDAIYPSREAALADIPFGPRKPGESEPFAYYRGVGGLVVPTVFSPATTPVVVDTMLAARRELARQVQEELTVLALALAGGLLIRGAYGIIKRIRGALSGRSAGAAEVSPSTLGQNIGEAVRSLPGGRRVEIGRRVSAAKLSQGDAAVATGEASRVAFGRIGGTVRLPNGDVVVPSVQPGMNQPIFVVRPTGEVLPARATISVPTPIDPVNPVKITDVKLE